jgi:phosphotransferase system HPr-like phosphotransfer protein
VGKPWTLLLKLKDGESIVLECEGNLEEEASRSLGRF